MFNQIYTIVLKNIKIEYRNKYAINGVLVYVISSIFVCYKSFSEITPDVWNSLFWIIILFASINATSKSFYNKTKYGNIYNYTLVSPRIIIISTAIYNFIVLSVLSLIALFFYSIVFKNIINDMLLFLSGLMLGNISFAIIFSILSQIISKANNSPVLISILGFPIILPVIMTLLKISTTAIMGMPYQSCLSELYLLVAINMIAISMALVLFPYLWRD